MKCDCEYCDPTTTDDELFAEFKGGAYRAAQMLGGSVELLDQIIRSATRAELIRKLSIYGAPL